MSNSARKPSMSPAAMRYSSMFIRFFQELSLISYFSFLSYFLAILYFMYPTTIARIQTPKNEGVISVLSAAYFHEEPAAYAYLEGILWPYGPVCPHCGNCEAKRIGVLKGKSTRIGVRKCYACRKPFTVKVGTVFESSHIPLHNLLQAVYLLTSSKKGFSAHQLHRVLEITYKSAWLLAHRIREAMRTGGLAPMGGNGVSSRLTKPTSATRRKCPSAVALATSIQF